MASSIHQSELFAKKIVLDGHHLTIEQVISAAKEPQGVQYVLSEQTLKMIKASNALKAKLIEARQPIYGVTTGFGDSWKRQISPNKAADLQRNMVHYHLNGTGQIASIEVSRANTLIRANCLSRGNSAVRVDIIERLIFYIENDIVPLIPERGSVGASGDLVPNCYLAATLIGEGEVWYKGRVRETSNVLAEVGVDPLTLEAKEGLALINGTSFMSAFAVLACWDALELARVADVCTAMASDALLGNRGHFASFIHEQKPHPGQLTSALLIHNLLEDSQLARDYCQILAANPELKNRGYLELEQPIQDKYSIRCAPHITGVLYDTLRWVREWVETEINSSNDNPLFDVKTQSVHNGGNFYGGHIAQAMDALKVAIANIADLLDRQLELIVDEKFNNGLTPNLIPVVTEDDYEAGLHHGFKGMQLASSAMTAEALKIASPMSVFSRSTEAHNQDKVSMGTVAAREAHAIIELVQNVAAIHLLALCQALDLRGKTKMSPKNRLVYDLIRTHVPFLDHDRRMDGDIKQTVKMLQDHLVSAALQSLFI